jgi:nuclear pore complex protein Nup160
MAQKRKRPHASEGEQQRVQVEVRTISDIEKDYSLVRTKLSLLRMDPSMANQIYSPFVSPEEVVARLIQVGLFDKAIDTALCFELTLDSIFEALASRCVHLTNSLVGFRDETDDASNWNWLDANESIDIPTPIERSVVDKAWLMLKSYLRTYDHVRGHKLQKCVARKLLSLGSHLPQWLIQSFKETNPAELLHLYLSFNLLEEAAVFALQYIDAVLGPRREEFAMQATLHSSSPSVWLPYSSLDHLREALQKAESTSLMELSSQLTAKLEDYFRTATSVTADMEHQARQTMMVTH